MTDMLRYEIYIRVLGLRDVIPLGLQGSTILPTEVLSSLSYCSVRIFGAAIAFFVLFLLVSKHVFRAIYSQDMSYQFNAFPRMEMLTLEMWALIIFDWEHNQV